MEYEVRMGDKVIGNARVERRGLYYHIQVRCSLEGDMMHKVLVRCEGREENLGVLVPVDGQFGMDTRIPVKKIGEGIFEFLVLPRHRKISGEFIPLSPEEPFRYISRLKHAFLENRNGVVGLNIKSPGCP